MNNSSISLYSFINGVNHDIHDVVNNVVFGNKNQNKWAESTSLPVFLDLLSIYGLLTERQVNMAGYWPSSFSFFLFSLLILCFIIYRFRPA